MFNQTQIKNIYFLFSFWGTWKEIYYTSAEPKPRQLQTELMSVLKHQLIFCTYLLYAEAHNIFHWDSETNLIRRFLIKSKAFY